MGEGVGRKGEDGVEGSEGVMGFYSSKREWMGRTHFLLALPR